MAELLNTKRFVHISGLSPNTIKLVRTEYEVDYTDKNNEEECHLFHWEGLLDWLQFIKTDPSERTSTELPQEQYDIALEELEALRHDMEPYDYFSMDGAE